MLKCRGIVVIICVIQTEAFYFFNVAYYEVVQIGFCCFPIISHPELCLNSLLLYFTFLTEGCGKEQN